jgi:hypothetical protein
LVDAFAKKRNDNKNCFTGAGDRVKAPEEEEELDDAGPVFAVRAEEETAPRLRK